MRSIELSRLLSWTLVLISAIVLLLGYSLTVADVESSVVIWGHRILGGGFAFISLLHMCLSIYLTRKYWGKTLRSILKGKANRLTWLRFLQITSGLGLIFSASFVLISGLDWFKIGTGWLVPFSSHIFFDIFLSLIVIVHAGAGLKFALLRRRIKRKGPKTSDGFSAARREAITVLASMALALIAVTYLDRVPRIANVKEKISELIPPGQYAVATLRVLHVGLVPQFDEENWDFEVYGLVRNPMTMSYAQLKELPKTVSVSDFHCVTGWSRLSNVWEGLRLRTLMKMVKPLQAAKYATIECENDYTTSLPLEDLERDDVILAYNLDDEKLPPPNGGPLRIVVPQKYGYKSGKWVRKIKFTEKQESGYWETRGYSNTADPFSNDRYSSSLPTREN